MVTFQIFPAIVPIQFQGGIRELFAIQDLTGSGHPKFLKGKGIPFHISVERRLSTNATIKRSGTFPTNTLSSVNLVMRPSNEKLRISLPTTGTWPFFAWIFVPYAARHRPWSSNSLNTDTRWLSRPHWSRSPCVSLPYRSSWCQRSKTRGHCKTTPTPLPRPGWERGPCERLPGEVGRWSSRYCRLEIARWLF